MHQETDRVTSDLNAYMSQIDKALQQEADMEPKAPYLLEEELKMIDEISDNGDLILEAIGAEATLISINQLNAELQTALIEAIQFDSASANENLGQIMKELTIDYLSRSFKNDF